MAQCTFLVPWVKNCQSPVYVILFMSNNLSTNLSRHLQRVNISEISLHFNLPSLYSCRTWSLLLRVLISIPARGLSRYSYICRTSRRGEKGLEMCIIPCSDVMPNACHGTPPNTLQVTNTRSGAGNAQVAGLGLCNGCYSWSTWNIERSCLSFIFAGNFSAISDR